MIFQDLRVDRAGAGERGGAAWEKGVNPKTSKRKGGKATGDIPQSSDLLMSKIKKPSSDLLMSENPP